MRSRFFAMLSDDPHPHGARSATTESYANTYSTYGSKHIFASFILCTYVLLFSYTFKLKSFRRSSRAHNVKKQIYIHLIIKYTYRMYSI